MSRLAGLALSAVVAALLLPAVAAPDAARAPVVVELFTSEGCSDCPPADALLAELERTQPIAGAQIIPLEEHVDYWDHQGWRDPFSSRTFTTRQESYAERLRIASPYTPQMVIDGHWEFVGSAAQRAREAIASAAGSPHTEVKLRLEAAPSAQVMRLAIQVMPLPEEVREGQEVWFAITEDGLASQVNAGENAGRHLQHAAVVRRLAAVGHFDPRRDTFEVTGEQKIDAEWKRERLRGVAIVSGARSGRIYGAASSTLNQ